MTSINSGTIPSGWKTHKITPVHKSGDKTSVTNYRPISLLCIISKVLERLIYDKIIDLVASSLIRLQFGFQRGSSTLQQLLLYFHQLITSKEEIDVIYIDFLKAFDSMPHSKLLIKLWNMGTTGTLWRWFASYLSNTSQCVSVNSYLSSFFVCCFRGPSGQYSWTPVISNIYQWSALHYWISVSYIYWWHKMLSKNFYCSWYPAAPNWSWLTIWLVS